MAVFLAPIINDQQENSNGAPLSGGTIEVYLAGTSTAATTYSDKAGLVPNTWPITLNTLGVNSQGAVWITGGATYKFIIKDSTGVVQRTIDNVSGVNDTALVADEWVVFQGVATFVSATSFSLAGDQTQTFQVGRRLKTANTGGTIYSTIVGSVYSAPNTTITVRNDSGSLDSGLSVVAYGVLSVLNTSLPGGMINYGQCQLVKSGANLVLQPYNGNRITINGSVCVIPSAGVTLAPTGTVAGTRYYIYAYISGGVLTLEYSVTGHSTDTVTGVEIKTGDVTRTLVGMARPITGPAWQDTTAQRLVISWFNRRAIHLGPTVLGANQGNAGLSPTEITAGLRNEFLCWGSEATSLSFEGALSNNVNAAVSTTFLAVDGAAVESYSASQASSANAYQPVSCSHRNTLVEGYHYASPFAYQNVVSTALYVGGGAAGARCVNSGVIQG